MTDWRIILFVSLLTLLVSLLIFLNIRFYYSRRRLILSSLILCGKIISYPLLYYWELIIHKIINLFSENYNQRNQDNERNNNPEPCGIIDVELLNAIPDTNTKNNKSSNNNTTEYDSKPYPSIFATIIFTHIKSIIKRLKKKCNEKGIEPGKQTYGLRHKKNTLTKSKQDFFCLRFMFLDSRMES